MFLGGSAILAAVLFWLLVVNLLTYVAFFVDKRRAIAGQWRLREADLLLLAFLGGSPGAKLAQRLFRHKTRKEPFRTTLNMIFLLHVFVLASLAVPGIRQGIADRLPLAGLTGFARDQPADAPPAMPRRFGPGS